MHEHDRCFTRNTLIVISNDIDDAAADHAESRHEHNLHLHDDVHQSQTMRMILACQQPHQAVCIYGFGIESQVGRDIILNRRRLPTFCLQAMSSVRSD